MFTNYLLTENYSKVAVFILFVQNHSKVLVVLPHPKMDISHWSMNIICISLQETKQVQY